MSKLVSRLLRRARPTSYATAFPGRQRKKMEYIDVLSYSTQAYTQSDSAREVIGCVSATCPAFSANASDIEIVKEPTAFYEQLKSKIATAKKRIVLASLYLGHEPKPLELTQTIEEALRNNPELELVVLLDALRGSRNVAKSKSDATLSSITILQPLVKQFPGRVTCFFYHTPELAGFWKKVIPQRFNELIGVQHIKCYIVDNDTMLSGANLSEQYFTNRQDRYVWMKNNADIADFYAKFIDTIGSFSFQINATSKDSVLVMSDPKCPDPSKDPDNFRVESGKRLIDFWTRYLKASPKPSLNENDTWVFPTMQTAPSNVTIDQQVTENLLQAIPQGQDLWLTSPYFNFNDRYKQLILSGPAKHSHIIVAHPHTNGFYKGSGVSGMVPWAYNNVLEEFFNETKNNSNLIIKEYIRAHHTFHAKGLWFDIDSSASATLVGSSNFGVRSILRDLESQVFVVSSNKSLVDRLHEERDYIFKDSENVNEEAFAQRKGQASAWVPLVIPFAKNYM